MIALTFIQSLIYSLFYDHAHIYFPKRSFFLLGSDIIEKKRRRCLLAGDKAMSSFKFRFATREDIPLILHFIKELADYEKLLHEVVATEEILDEWLFEKNKAEVIFVLEGEKEVGFALFFHNFSTFLGRSGIYLEDLFVIPEYRGKGYGKALLEKLAQIAVERGCGRLEWWVLDWNTPSIEFYKAMGAVPMDEWTVFRISGDTLQQMGTK